MGYEDSNAQVGKSVLLGTVNFRFIMVLLYLQFIYYMYALKNPVTKNNVSLRVYLWVLSDDLSLLTLM